MKLFKPVSKILSLLLFLFALNRAYAADNIFTDNVGMGTTSPSDRLHITVSNSDTVFPTYLTGMVVQNTDNTNGNYNTISFKNSTTTGYDMLIGGIHLTHGTGSSRRGAFVVATSGANTSGAITERMRIDSEGNVGIGTTGPVYPLEVALPNKVIGLRGDGSNAFGVGFLSAGENSYFIKHSGTTNVLNIGYDSGGDQNVITVTTGNVGIGTTSPQGKLQIGNPDSTTGGQLFKTMSVLHGTATTFFTVSDSGKWGGVIEMTAVAENDNNRQCYYLVRYAYSDPPAPPFTTITTSGQNLTAAFSVSGNNFQVTMSGMADQSYRLTLRIFGTNRD